MVCLADPSLVRVSVNRLEVPACPTALSCVALSRIECPCRPLVLPRYEWAARTA